MANQNVGDLKGGPFAAVIVKDGEVIASSCNLVTSTNDPTAHAEIATIREACRKLNTFELKDCIIYSSCEPCPMCLGAIYWARISKIYYAADRHDAADAGFDDEFLYRELLLPESERSITISQVADADATSPFEQWKASGLKIAY